MTLRGTLHRIPSGRQEIDGQGLRSGEGSPTVGSNSESNRQFAEEERQISEGGMIKCHATAFAFGYVLRRSLSDPRGRKEMAGSQSSRRNLQHQAQN
jgi:hypothetical protein